MGSVYLRTSVTHGLIAGLGLSLLLGLAGCSRKPAPPPQLAPGQTAQGALSKADQEAAQAAVIDYLRALYDQNYSRAYDLLSAASQQRHPKAAFTKEVTEGQVVYDLGQVEVEGRGPGRAEVIVALEQEEEPARKAFSTVKEAGRWKVVYLSGKPFFPYGE